MFNLYLFKTSYINYRMFFLFHAFNKCDIKLIKHKKGVLHQVNEVLLFYSFYQYYFL